MHMKTLRLLALACMLPAATMWAAPHHAKNVIIFLGDAGGIPTLDAASIQAYGDPHKMFLFNMPHMGLSETSSADNWVTDSAAGMTAIVTGEKTDNGVLSESAAAVRGKDDGKPLKTLLEYAEERGLSTGLISNDSMIGATPAACFAHVNDRGMGARIISALLEPRFGDGVDVFIASGRRSVLKIAEGNGLDLSTALEKKGYKFADNMDALQSRPKRAIILLEDHEFDVLAAINSAVDILSENPKGFFLMVESDMHTDHVKHGLDRAAAFDRTIQATVQRMRSNTLLLFTADHSFDLRLAGKAPKGQPLTMADAKADKTTPTSLTVFGHHSGEPVLVAADGPGSDKIHGLLTNTDLFQIVLDAYGWQRDSQARHAAIAAR